MEVKVTKSISSILKVTGTETNVSVQSTGNKVVTVTAPGPQGPPFSGASFFNVTAIDALGPSDTGTVLTWDGSLFQPVAELENDLIISGGAF